jgi:hypothetical protein
MKNGTGNLKNVFPSEIELDVYRETVLKCFGRINVRKYVNKAVTIRETFRTVS